MKKILVLMLALVMVCALAACGAKENADVTKEAEEASEFGMPSPVTDYESLEALNEATGAKLAKPAVMGVTDESYCTIDCTDYVIAQYKFTVAGKDYTFRFSDDFTHDISGIYVGDKTAFEGVEGEGNIATEDCLASRWMNVDGQYVLAVTGDELDAESFDSIATEMQELVLPVDSENQLLAIYNSLEGSYQDKTSQRASAEVESLGKDGVKITVEWADSADKTNTWEFTAKKYEDGLFSYTDCKSATVDYSESEDGAETVNYTDGEGSFYVDEAGNIVWDGAADENCAKCVFEKIPTD